MMQGRVKTARPALALKETKFENDRLARLGVEAMSFSYLFKRTTVRALSLPERVHFYMLSPVSNHAKLDVKYATPAGGVHTRRG